MNPLTWVIVAGALLGIVGLVGRHRKARLKRTPAHRSEPPAPPTFRVVALGVSGAGKTVLLSSMFHRLNFPENGRSYFLEADAEHRIALAKVYDTVSDTNQPWPRGTRTGETREFVFDCVAFDETRQKHRVLKISYLDYAGELLETEQAEAGTALQDVTERIRHAHALLGMIDGYRVVQLLRGEPGGRRYFQSSIQPMLGMMQGATCPIHLVITKWDLVRGFGEPDDADDHLRLRRVIDALMSYDQIRGLVFGRGLNQIVRLIPVSAVGPGFAQVDASGTVVKRSDGQIRPKNVDVPISAVVPDIFRQVELSLDETTRKAVDRFGRNVASGMTAFVRGPAATALRVALLATLGRDFGHEGPKMFLEWVARPFQPDSTTDTDRFHQVRAMVLGDFTRAVLRLEVVLPDSVLTGR